MSPNIFASGQSGYQVGVDLGSAKLRLSQPPHESVLQEPNILIRNTKTDRVVAIGQEAADLRGRTPEHFSFVQPVVDSVIAHPEAAVTVLSRISHRYRSWWESVLGQNFLVSIPAGAADTDIRTFANVFSHFSSRSVRAVPASLAALRGIEVSVDDPLAQMVVDIGSDVTNIGVVSQRSVIQFATSNIAGCELDSAIQDYVRTKRNLHISQIQAEAIKLKSAYCGTAEDAAEEITVYGQDTASRLPREITVSPDDAHRAIQPTIDELSTFVQNFLQSLSADTAADVYTHGVHLVGGTAAMPGLAEELEDVLSISVYEYNDPATAVASGLGEICARPKLQQSINTFDPYASVQSIDQ
jgi:rod shape-determining protein MreB